MEGLLGQMPEQEGMPEENPMMEGEGDPNIGSGLQEEAATEEEQKMYEALAEPMLGILHSEKTSAQIESALKGGTSIGQLTFDIAMAVVGQIEKNGKKVPEDLLQTAAEDVVDDLIQIKIEMGLLDPNDEAAIEKEFIDGLMEAIDLYGNQKRQTGQMTPEEQKQRLEFAAQQGGFDKNKITQAMQQGGMPNATTNAPTNPV